MAISCVSSLAYKNALYKIISCLGHNTDLHCFFSIDFNELTMDLVLKGIWKSLAGSSSVKHLHRCLAVCKRGATEVIQVIKSCFA